MCRLLPRNGPISFHIQVKTWQLSTEFEEYPVGGFDAGYGSLKLQNTSILFFIS